MEDNKQDLEYPSKSSSIDHVPTPSQKDAEIGTQVAKTAAPPDGGITAWVQVAGAFMLTFNTWGILNAFGVYQTYYESGLLFEASSSNISWIGAIEAFLLLLTGIFAGPIYDRGHLRFLLVGGGFLVVFGHMMLSICNTYWQVVLSQGVVIGLGTGLLFVPCVAILPQYFSTRLGLAMGLSAAGSSFGGVIYPIVLYRLIDQIGFSWAVRVEGFIAMATLLVPATLLRLRVKPGKVRAMVDWSGFVDLPYITFVIIGVVAFMGLFVFFLYVSYYGLEQQILSTELAFYLVPIFNAASCFGRTLPNAISDITGPFNLMAPGCFLAGVCMFCFIATSSAGGIIAVAVLAGFVSGVMIGMPPLCFVAVTKDRSKLGTRMGMGYAIIGLGILAGGPAAGSILGQTTPLNWRGLWIFGGTASCVAGIGYYALRIAIYGWKLNIKA